MTAKKSSTKTAGRKNAVPPAGPERTANIHYRLLHDSDRKIAPFLKNLNKAYLKKYGHCPVCVSESIEGDGSVEINDNNAEQRVRCLDCGAIWVDLYQLLGFVDLTMPV